MYSISCPSDVATNERVDRSTVDQVARRGIHAGYRLEIDACIQFAVSGHPLTFSRVFPDCRGRGNKW